MNRLVLAIIVLLLAGPSMAETIVNIQTGLVPENTIVTIDNVVVVATRSNGAFVAESPYGANTYIWVFSGGDPGVVPGDLVNIEGEYYEYYDFSEIDITGGAMTAVGTAPIPAPVVVPYDQLTAEVESWESCQITLTDVMTVTTLPDAHGEWWAESVPDGNPMLYDDYWYDITTVELGDVYDEVTGILVYSFGLYKMEPFADGVRYNGAVANERASFGKIKSLYR